MKERALSLIFVVSLSGFICSCSQENSPGGGAESAGGAAAGQESSPNAAPPMRFQLPPITDLHQLLTTNAEAFETRNVDISHAMVQRIFRDKQFALIGPDDSHTVPVELNGLYPQIKEGQEINVLGIIDSLGDPSQWNVLPAERQTLAGHTMFIRAISIKPSSS